MRKLTVGLLTIAWLVALGVVTLDWLAEAWAAGSDGDPSAGRVLLVLVGGPVLLTVTTVAGKLRGAAIAYGVLTAVLALVVAAVAWPAPADPVPAPTHCVEFSGGDSRCPGG